MKRIWGGVGAWPCALLPRINARRNHKCRPVSSVSSVRSVSSVIQTPTPNRAGCDGGGCRARGRMPCAPTSTLVLATGIDVVQQGAAPPTPREPCPATACDGRACWQVGVCYAPLPQHWCLRWALTLFSKGLRPQPPGNHAPPLAAMGIDDGREGVCHAPLRQCCGFQWALVRGKRAHGRAPLRPFNPFRR